jgi:hypothetical protein
VCGGVRRNSSFFGNQPSTKFDKEKLDKVGEGRGREFGMTKRESRDLRRIIIFRKLYKFVNLLKVCFKEGHDPVLVLFELKKFHYSHFSTWDNILAYGSN